MVEKTNQPKEAGAEQVQQANETPQSEEQVKASGADHHDFDEYDGVTFEVVEGEEVEGGKKIRRRGVYLLPNLFTTGALFSGFYAIIAAMNGMFEQSAIAVFVAMILDGLDGRVARMTNTQSEFGANATSSNYS